MSCSEVDREKQPLVLVVDDEMNIRRTISRSLKNADCQVETAVNGEEALAIIEAHVPDVVLLDMRMPGMSGLDLLKELSERKIQTKIVIITAYGTVENAVEAMKLGAVDFLQKPFTPKDIRDLVEDLLHQPSPDEMTPDEENYDELVYAGRSALKSGDYELAEGWLHKARAVSEGKAEVENLLGALHELQGNREQALKMYRSALSLQPGYQPSKENLDRITELGSEKYPINLGDR